MKKVAILQSNYIPWKGYFDLIAAVDEFIIYDDVQYTRRDWRNRNKIKTSQGLQWLTVPVKVRDKYHQTIRDTEVNGTHWQIKHWKTLQTNYGRSAHFKSLGPKLEDLYTNSYYTYLSMLNRRLIEWVCQQLGISTNITDCSEYRLIEGKTHRLVYLCQQAGATEYISGPSAKAYLDQQVFFKAGIDINFIDYSGYPSYPQLWGDFHHEVTILDLLFNCGPDAPKYMRYVNL